MQSEMKVRCKLCTTEFRTFEATYQEMTEHFVTRHRITNAIKMMNLTIAKETAELEVD